MRLNWMIQNHQLSSADIAHACEAFYHQHKTVADTVKIPLRDYTQFIGTMYAHPQFLEKGKDYGVFIPIAGGLVELLILDQDEVVHNSYHNGTTVSMMVVECTKVDREFEKHVLNGGKE